jgi:hypothetical protein
MLAILEEEVPMKRLRALLAAAVIGLSGCVAVAGPSGGGAGRQTYVCVKCGNVKETAGKSGNAPSCHGQKMIPQ